MRITGKTLLIAIGALVGVLVLAVVSFVVFFPKKQAVALVQHQIEQATGRTLTLAGDVEITFWPALGFSAKQASLSNPRGFGATPFLAADRIVFAVAVMPLLTGHVEVKQLILEGADLRLEAKADGSANWTFPTDPNQSQNHSTIDDLKLDDVRLSHSRIAFQGADSAPPLALENVEASLALASLDQPAQLQASFDHRAEHVQVTSTIGKPRAVLDQTDTPYSLDLRAKPIHATFQGVFNAGTGALNGHVAADGASLRDLLAWVGSPLGPGGGFGAYRLEGQMAHSGDNTALTETALHLDAIDAHGALTIAAPPNRKLHVGGSLTAPAIDLNPYLPPPPQGTTGGVQASTAWTNDPIDLSGLRAIDADIQFATPTLKFQHLTFTDAQLALKIANGAADARLTHIALYNGMGWAHLIADGASATPRIGFEIDARGIDAATFLRDAVGFDKIQGHGRVIASLAGQGRSQAAIMHSLHGTSSFDFTDGAFQGVDLGQIARVISTLQGNPTTGASTSTGFSDMSASFTVDSGAAATNNLHLISPLLRLDGTGVIDLGAQTIDMRLEPHPVNTQHTQTAQSVLGVPFQITGAWAHPSFRPAIGDLVRNQLRDRILSHQQPGSPLSALGAAIFGSNAPASPAATSTSTATTAPAAPRTTTTTTTTSTTTRPADVLNQIFGRH